MHPAKGIHLKVALIAIASKQFVLVWVYIQVEDGILLVSSAAVVWEVLLLTLCMQPGGMGLQISLRKPVVMREIAMGVVYDGM